MKKAILQYLYIYILLSGIAFLLFFYIFYLSRLENANYLLYNYILLFISVVLTSINSVKTHYQNYKRRFSKEVFFLLIFITQGGILFISQPGAFYLVQNLIIPFHVLSLAPVILSVLPFTILMFVKIISHKLVKSYQVSLGESRDINEKSPLAFLAYEFIEGLFINSFVLHTTILNNILTKL